MLSGGRPESWQARRPEVVVGRVFASQLAGDFGGELSILILAIAAVLSHSWKVKEPGPRENVSLQ